MSEAPKVGSYWRHKKTNHKYIVIGGAVIEATMAESVVYRRMPLEADPRCWVRPVTEFLDGRFEPTKKGSY